MSKNSEHHDTYIIPPNFIEGSTLFGGMFKIRNVIEAGVLAAAVGVPVFSLDLSLTVRIIILCLTALPLALFALMGIAGEPLSSYIIAFFKWLKNRRVVGKTEPKEERKKPKPKKEKQPAPENESMLSEIAGVIRKQSAKKKHTEEPRAAETPKQKKPHRRSKADSPFLNPVAEYLPIEKIANGIIYTKDHRYIKLIEVVPINFLLRSAREQRSIIYSFISYLKISPVKIQFKVLTKRADLNKHTEIVHREMEAETDPNCRVLQEDYLKHHISLPVQSEPEEDGLSMEQLSSADDTLDRLLEEQDICMLLQNCKRQYAGTARLGIEAIEWKVKGLSGAEIAKMYGVKPNLVGAWISRAAGRLKQNRDFMQYFDRPVEMDSS